MGHELKYNGSSVHITGVVMKTMSDEFAMNHCASLTRNGYKMATAKTEPLEDAGQALKKARSLARAIGKKLCKRCEAAALATIDEEARS